jgi:hypothetical protein
VNTYGVGDHPVHIKKYGFITVASDGVSHSSPPFSDLLLGSQDDVHGGKAELLLQFFKRSRSPESLHADAMAAAADIA